MAKGKQLTPAEFCVIWTTSLSVKEAAERLGVLPNRASARASFYRRRGVKLKFMPKASSRPLDVEGLNKIISKSAGGRP